MTTWAATNSRITPWTMLMMSTGMSVARCIEPAPARMHPEEQGGADHAERVRPTEQRDGDPVEAEVDEVLGGVVLGDAQDLDAPPRPASPPAMLIVRTVMNAGRMPGVACGAGVRADGPDLEAERRLEQEEPDDERGEERHEDAGMEARVGEDDRQHGAGQDVRGPREGRRRVLERCCSRGD